MITTTIIKVDFSSTRGYSLLEGSIIGSGGNPGACLDGGVGGHDGPGCENPTLAQIRVDLPSVSTVLRVAMDRWKQQPDPWNNPWSVGLFDKDGILLDIPIQGIGLPEAHHTWLTGDSGIISVPNVAYAVFTVGTCDAPIDLVSRMDNCIIEFIPGGQPEPNNPGDSSCGTDKAGQNTGQGVIAGEPSTGDPIGIRHGEKREAVTDLRIATPASELAFARYYGQFSQTNSPNLLGLGWKHNHYSQLTKIMSPSKISIRLPNGGEALFTEDLPDHPDHYLGVAGVNSIVDWNTVTHQYTLTNVDHSTLVFDSDGNLISRTWPNGEAWTYSYTGSQLAEISDGYGRKLAFRYYSGGSFNDQLYRVGDQTFDDTNPSSPTGRYVEYGYTLNKTIDSAGAIANGTQALLTSVKDLRGNTWLYEYYGQDGLETNPHQLNLLVRRKSPMVDLDGDEVANSRLTLEEVSYTLHETELAVNGDMEANSAWVPISGAAPDVHEQSDDQADDGTYSWHVQVTSTSPAEQGIEGNAWDLIAGRNYIISARVYPVSGEVKMQVSGETAFDTISQSTGEWETLWAVYNPLVGGTDRKLQFVAHDGTVEFYVDNVSITEQVVESIHQELGEAQLITDYAFQPDSENITTETIAGKVTTHHFLGGVLSGTEDAAQTGQYAYQLQDKNYRPVIQVDANGNQSQLTWENEGRQLSSVTDPFGAETSFEYYPDGPLEGTLKASIDAIGRKTSYMYDGNLRQPSLIIVSTDAEEIDIKGDMELVADWTKVDVSTVNELGRTADSGDYYRRVEADTVGQGIESRAWDILNGSEYTITARVFPVSGTVTMQVPGISALTDTSVGTGAWETLSATFTATEDALNSILQFVADTLSSGKAEFYVDSVSLLENGVEIDVAGHMENKRLENSSLFWNGIVSAPPLVNERHPGKVAGLTARHVITDDEDKGIESENTFSIVEAHDYLLLARVYPITGQVQMNVPGVSQLNAVTSTTPADMETWQTLRAVFRTEDYESDLTDIPVQFLTMEDGGEFYVDAVHLIDVTGLLQWQDFRYDGKGRAVEEASVNIKTAQFSQQVNRTYAYSGNGNGLLESVTQRSADGVSDDVTTTYTYDSAGRVVKTKQSSLFGSCTLSYTVYDEAGNVTATVCVNPEDTGTSIPMNVEEARAFYNNDPGNPEKAENKVTTYAYDALGRRVKTIINDSLDEDVATTNPDKQVSLTFYDALNRVTRTISNYGNDEAIYTAPGGWLWNGTAWKDETNMVISHGDDNNQNIIQDTAYNARGMVKRQQDTLGNVTLYGYDDAGRLVKTIQSASNGGYNNDYIDPDPDPTLESYAAELAPDKDIITTQAYDAVGNIVKTVDPLGHVNFTVYDALNRPVKTVEAAHEDTTVSLSPGDPDYNAAHDPRSVSYAISLDPDQDLIQTTEYDSIGRVIRTKQLMENRPTLEWNTTLYGYDLLGRQIITVQNAGNPDFEITPNTNWDTYSGTGIDIITRTVYDSNGRVLYTQDTNYSQTWIGYDGLGRQVKTIVNVADPFEAVSDGSAADPRSDSYVPSTDADKDLISTTTYNADGQVESTQDALGRITRHVYDARGRVTHNIANYVSQGTSNPFNWVWSDGNARWEDGAGNAIDQDTDVDQKNDQNMISQTVYDVQGRVSQTIDNRHNVTQFVYDKVGRRIKIISNVIEQGTHPALWEWDETDGRWEDGAGNAIDFGADNDQNRISQTLYDLAGRAISTRDAAGVETIYRYDAAGRRSKTVTQYQPQGTSEPADWEWSAANQRWEDGDGNAIDFGAHYDQNLINATTYNKAGQVVSTRDVRGTQTTFTYDQVSRRRTVTQASGNPLTTTHYTAYDKAGRVLRSIANYMALEDISPDGKMGSVWDFVPSNNGSYNDTNLITEFEYDLAGRRTRVIDPVGNITQTAYFNGGQVEGVTDPAGVVTKYRYDGLRRRVRVVQGYVATPSFSDPAAWTWNATAGLWKYLTITIGHGDDNDENIIVDVTYDKGGRVLTQRDPRGNLTTYAYDHLDRRITLTKPITLSPLETQTWRTAYSELAGGKSRVTMTYPGISGVSNYPVNRDFDRLGRLQNVQFGAPSVTPDVMMTYDGVGNRTKMSEYKGTGFSNLTRETQFTYDKVHRLTQAEFNSDNTDNLGTIDESVSYEYDTGGLRTKLTLPGSLDVVYIYDQRGQLLSLTDWANQTTQFAYDNVGRHIATERANKLRSRYRFDAGGRLRMLRHTKDFQTLAHFEYQVDSRGNRTQALEVLANTVPDPLVDTVIASDSQQLKLSGEWSLLIFDGRTATQVTASLKLLFYGNEATLTMLEGPYQSMYDVYINGTLWQSFDGYAAVGAYRDIVLTADVDGRKLQGEGPHLLEIRNRAEKNKDSLGYLLTFKQLTVPGRTWTQQNIGYYYDKLSRLKEARYNPGISTTTTDPNLSRRYLYTYDRAGNRTQQSIAVNGGSPTVTNYTYNAANQLVNDGTNTPTYDNNSNLTDDGVNSYTWDRANRLLTWDNGVTADLVNHTYDGEGRRVSQAVGTTSPLVTKYLLDIQPGLAVVLSQDVSGSVSRFVHAPRGIHARQDSDDLWHWTVQDGLGTVRVETDNSVVVEGAQNLDPFGNLIDLNGTIGTPFGFTGELVDGSGLLDLRARRYNAGLGAFANLDPFEGVRNRAMSLNGYSWVEGNVVNEVDPSGMCIDTSVCKELRAKSLKAAIAAGCSSQLGECCGPDASKWLFTEFASHNSYAAGAFLQDLENQYNNSPSDLPSRLSALADLAPQALKRLMAYGLAVDYSNINYRQLEVQSRQSSGCSDSITPRYICEQRQEPTISVCGNCENASNYGNFIFGVALYAASQTPFMAGASGIIFNTVQAFGNGKNNNNGDFLQGILAALKSLPDVYSDADTQGVLAGYDFASKNQNILKTSYSREAFCQAMNSLGGAWKEPLDQSDFSFCGIEPCNADGPNLNYAAHIPPDWNVYSSSITNPGGMGTPDAELKAKFGM